MSSKNHNFCCRYSWCNFLYSEHITYVHSIVLSKRSRSQAPYTLRSRHTHAIESAKIVGDVYNNTIDNNTYDNTIRTSTSRIAPMSRGRSPEVSCAADLLFKKKCECCRVTNRAIKSKAKNLTIVELNFAATTYNKPMADSIPPGTATRLARVLQPNLASEHFASHSCISSLLRLFFYVYYFTGVQAKNCCGSNRLVCSSGEDWENYTYTCPEHQETLEHTYTRAVHCAVYLPGLRSRLQGNYAEKAYTWSQLRERRLKEKSMLVTGLRERRDDDLELSGKVNRDNSRFLSNRGVELNLADHFSQSI